MAAVAASSQDGLGMAEPLTGSLPSIIPSSSLGGTGQFQATVNAHYANGNGNLNGTMSEAAESDGESVGTAGGGARRPQARNFQDWNAIPKVKDLTGEKVCEDFLAFLEK